MDIEKLQEYVRIAEKLDEVLTKRPAIVAYLSILQNGAIPPPAIYANELLHAGEVAKRLKVNVNRVYEYVEQGLLVPCFTPPKSNMKFRSSDIDEFILRLPSKNFQ